MRNRYSIIVLCFFLVGILGSCERSQDGLLRAQALIAYNQGKWDESMKLYRKLLEKYPDDANLHWRLGTVAYSQGDLLELRRQIMALRKLNQPKLTKELESFLEDAD